VLPSRASAGQYRRPKRNLAFGLLSTGKFTVFWGGPHRAGCPLSTSAFPQHNMRLSKRTKPFKEFRRQSTRFSVEVPALFWSAPGTRSKGMQTLTKNISRTGLYLQGEANLPIGAPILFELELPAPFGGGTGGLLRGRGRLVRSEVRGNTQIGVGATIDRYEFLPAANPSPPGKVSESSAASKTKPSVRPRRQAPAQ